MRNTARPSPRRRIPLGRLAAGRRSPGPLTLGARAPDLLTPGLLALGLLTSGLLAGCGGAPERDCPAPIGRIVLEDCEVYQRRFEALEVDLRALIGDTSIRVGVARTPMRERAKPGEALDVLAHRLHTLCRDHNACRLPSAEWRTRREALDETVTALGVLRDRIAAEHDPAARAALIDELNRVLASGAGPAPETRRRAYSSWLPWFGAVHRPAQPDPPVGAPYLAGVDLDTQARFARGQGVVGYAPSGRFDLWWPGGAFQVDDALVVDWADGHRAECPLRGRGNGDDHRSVTCRAPEAMVSTADRIEATVSYRTGVDGVEHRLGRISAPVVAHRVDGPDRAPTWDVDLDPVARRGLLVWRPHDGALPAEVDQPSLYVVLKLRAYAKPTARCRIAGQDAFGVLRPTRYSGQEGTHQDRPRYRQVAPGRSVGEPHPFVEWWRYDFALPLGVSRDGAPLPEGLASWPRPGDWHCTVTVDGEPVRRLRFVVRPDGQLDPLPEQAREARAAWLVDTEVVPSSVEEPL